MATTTLGWQIIIKETCDQLIKIGFPEIEAEAIAYNVTTAISKSTNEESVRVAKNEKIQQRNILLYNLYLDGEHPKAIAEIFGLSVRAVYRVIKSEGKNE
jgi:hypothetical protein